MKSAEDSRLDTAKARTACKAEHRSGLEAAIEKAIQKGDYSCFHHVPAFMQEELVAALEAEGYKASYVAPHATSAGGIRIVWSAD